MGIMELSRRSNASTFLYDPIRKKNVTHTPEEAIRQRLIQVMIQELGYPSSLIGVEKELCQLPHLSLRDKKTIPNRRADLIVFASRIHKEHSLFPLLMVECKAVALTPKFAQQVIGYNSVVEAPFVAIANDTQCLVGCFDSQAGIYRFKEGLPAYKDLLATVIQS